MCNQESVEALRIRCLIRCDMTPQPPPPRATLMKQTSHLPFATLLLATWLLLAACGTASQPSATVPVPSTLAPVPAIPSPQSTDQRRPPTIEAPANSSVQEPTAASPAPPETPVDEVQGPDDARVEDLLSQMTLAEKIGQMTQVESDSITPDEVTAYAIGSVLTGGSGAARPNTPEGWLRRSTAYQWAVWRLAVHRQAAVHLAARGSSVTL